MLSEFSRNNCVRESSLRVTEVLLEWLFRLKTTGISRNNSSASCHLCPDLLVALNPAQASRYCQNYPSTRFCWSQIQVCVVFPLNPALNPAWISDLFNPQWLFDLCCSRKPELWFPAAAAQREQVSSWTAEFLFSHTFLSIKIWRKKEKQMNYRV